ncbi:response regulator transcription factor [Anaerocolumna sp. MB42-C2]|uniref:response regulator transcription factor n=1 Tax=Anaerocolumna sp. MB42-C2 TaxID=3070997 RepID=UPI0027DF460F|nr:response regulator transcription factor [Anaerocolumna sp. MB42-C2]WMJ89129.1 response regulator transcription factor [Anaerocolumna sp. MB42-C2]
MYTILIVDDEPDIRNLIKETLTQKGYQCIIAVNGMDAYEKLKKNSMDLIITDIMMPLLDGFNLVREIRKDNNIPVIFLSARDENMDKILGLGLGADDYLVKPISMEELAARTEALLRRIKIYDTNQSYKTPIIEGCYTLDEEKRLLLIGGEEIPLIAKEYKLMAYFMKNPNRTLTKKQLYNAVWEDEYCFDDNTITATLSRLRSKVETNTRKCIHTVRGLGYKFSVKDYDC